MKYNITMRRTGSPSLTWWSYDFKCDVCGCEVLYGSKGYQCSQKPDIDEADICLECLREFLDAPEDQHETYEELRKRVYVPYNPEIKDITSQKVKEKMKKYPQMYKDVN